ncbi:MAG: hypothetical protein GWN16_04920, partial [Calditrichae bacterium]|nr:hypothetical protein [Calditrichia bacterium]
MMKGGMMSSGMMSGQGMMQGGMMGNMMNMMRMMHGKGMMQHHGPMLRFIHQVQHLPGMKAKLDLSDDQLDQLKNIRANFLKRKADWQADI